MKVTIDGIEYIPMPKAQDTSDIHLAALNFRFDSDVGFITIREYLHALLAKLWREGWAFNSKRPFGNSNWQHVLQKPLIEAGFVKGEIYIDDDGSTYVDTVAEAEFEEFVEKLIYAAFFGAKPEDREPDNQKETL